MSQEISVFGGRASIVASTTFPAGFDVTAFADNADPLDVSDLPIADSAVTVGGIIVHWAKVGVIKAKMAVIPFGEEDDNLAILYKANQPVRGNLIAYDSITMTFYYPQGRVAVFKSGRLVSAMPAVNAGSDGRLKTMEYSFNFGSVDRT